MGVNVDSGGIWTRLSEFIAETMGLSFGPERWADLQRGLMGAAEEFGFSDSAECADWILSERLTNAQLRVLASHLTVGETYFFRERKAFDALAEDILPELVHSRRGREQRLRLWSAACCTGEEAYSMAILLDQILPDLKDWKVTILATDINERFLQKAAAGVYGEWSFRDSPAWFKERYFRRTDEGRYTILRELKERVTFANLNLVEDVYPSLATDTNAMDVIFCRNVLMYFTPAQARKVVRNMHHALVDDGCLVVSPSEGSQGMFSDFVPVNYPGAILYRKGEARRSRSTLFTPTFYSGSSENLALPSELGFPEEPKAEEETPPPLTVETPADIDAPPSKSAQAELLYREGRYSEVVEALLSSFTPESAPEPVAFSLLTRALANQGKLADALVWCDRWVSADKLDSSCHYLRAMILQEVGDPMQARRSLQRALYLHQDFVLAHFALGNLAREIGESMEADRHFANALHLLRAYPPNEILPESDGLTAGRLTEIITSICALEATS